MNDKKEPKQIPTKMPNNECEDYGEPLRLEKLLVMPGKYDYFIYNAKGEAIYGDPVHKAEFEALFDRIVACMNACAGIPTSELIQKCHPHLHEIYVVCGKRSDDLFPGFNKAMQEKIFLDYEDAREFTMGIDLDCELVIWELTVGVYDKKSTAIKYPPTRQDAVEIKADNPHAAIQNAREFVKSSCGSMPYKLQMSQEAIDAGVLEILGAMQAEIAFRDLKTAIDNKYHELKKSPGSQPLKDLAMFAREEIEKLERRTTM